MVFHPDAILEIAGGHTATTQTLEDVPIALSLFELPVHIAHLPACLATKAAHPEWSLKKIASNLGINHMTVKRAFDYARRMQQVGAGVVKGSAGFEA